MTDDADLVVAVHFPLTPTPGIGADEYQYPWIDDAMEWLLDLDEDGDAWMHDDGEELGGEYVFFLTGRSESAALDAARVLAARPSMPLGGYAVVGDGDDLGDGERVEL